MQHTSPPQLQDLIASLDSHLTACDDPLLNQVQVDLEHQGVATERYLFLQKGQFYFALSMEYITELSPLGPVTPLPNLPAWINGVTSQRGEVVSAIDLPMYFGWVSAVAGHGEHIVSVEFQNVRVGICVDRIVGSGSVDPLTQIQTDVKPHQNSDVVFAKAHSLDEQICCIVDIQELLTQNKMLQW